MKQKTNAELMRLMREVDSLLSLLLKHGKTIPSDVRIESIMVRRSVRKILKYKDVKPEEISQSTITELKDVMDGIRVSLDRVTKGTSI